MMGDAVSITEDHRYFDTRGVEYVGVTSVTSKILDPDSARYFTEASAVRGSAVHLATALDDLGTLDEASVDPRIAGYLAAWRRFREEFGFVPVETERRVWCDVNRAAGTFDTLGYREKIPNSSMLLDKKSGVKSWTHGPQVAAYDFLRIAGTKWKPADVLATVYLKDDGSYEYVEVEDRHEALDLYLSGLQIAHARRRHAPARKEV